MTINISVLNWPKLTLQKRHFFFTHFLMIDDYSIVLFMIRMFMVAKPPPGTHLLPQTPWPSPTPGPPPTPPPPPPTHTHRPQPAPGEADRWHYVMRWWAIGAVLFVTAAHAWVNVLVWCRWKGNGHLTGRMNRWSWADSRHILVNWIRPKHFDSAAADKNAGISSIT